MLANKNPPCPRMELRNRKSFAREKRENYAKQILCTSLFFAQLSRFLAGSIF